MHPRIRTSLLVLVCSLVLVLVQPAAAIQYGEPDNGAHPYVGAMVVESPEFGVALWCSGTHLGGGVFLTAAHCNPDLFPEFELELLGVTFDDAFDPETSTIVPATAFIPNPAYDGTPYTDVAVILLASDPGVGAGALPELNALEALDPSNESGQQDRQLTAVGYGSTGLNRGEGGRPQFANPQIRMRAENIVTNLTKGWFAGLLVQTTAAPGTGGGTCYGDSGGPFFLAGTNIVVAITITGYNRNCGGADINLRIDTEPVLAFIGQYV